MRWLFALLFALIFAATPISAEEFVSGTEDLPLMTGLAIIPGSALVFDKPEGRIVEAQAHGALTRAKVEAFYDASLPQLGWKKLATDRWQRDAERLKLDFTGADGNLTVGFTIAPQ